jgi:hypothetical protein
VTGLLWSTLVVSAAFQDRRLEEMPGGRKWVRTTDPSLVSVTALSNVLAIRGCLVIPDICRRPSRFGEIRCRRRSVSRSRH